MTIPDMGGTKSVAQEKDLFVSHQESSIYTL